MGCCGGARYTYKVLISIETVGTFTYTIIIVQKGSHTTGAIASGKRTSGTNGGTIVAGD